MADPQTGDHWTYELRDDITGEVKSTITTTVTDVWTPISAFALACLAIPIPAT